MRKLLAVALCLLAGTVEAAQLGSWKIDDLLTFPANTHRFDTGVGTDADSAPSYRVYEDETGTAILTGSMALLDSSNTAGFYSEQITLSAANGFEKGKSYTVYIAATVNSVAGTTSHTFQIEAEVDSNSVSNIGSGVITATSIATDAIGADEVAAAAIGASELATDAIGAAELAADSITSSEIADDSIDAGALAASAIGASELAADSITSSEIADGAVDAGAIADASIDAATFAAGAVDASAVATDAIGAAELAANAIGASEVATDAIGAAELAADAVTEIRSYLSGTADSGSTTTLVDNALTQADANWWRGALLLMTSGTLAGQHRLITAFDEATDTITVDRAFTATVGTQTYEILTSGGPALLATATHTGAVVPTVSAVTAISAGGISASSFASGAIDATAIATDAIGADELGANSITSSEVADNSIDAGAVADATIDAATFAAGAIDASAIATDAVGAAELAANSITSSEVADDSIDAGAIATDAITATEVAASAIGASELASNSITSDELAQSAFAEFFSVDSGTTYASAVAGSVVKEIADNAGGSSLTETGIAETVAEYMFTWDTNQTYAGAHAESVVKQIADNAGGSALTEAGIAAAVWDLDATGHQTQGTFGQVLGDSAADTDSVWSLANTNLNATVGSRSTLVVTDNIGINLDDTAGTLDAAEIATDAIGAAELAADSIGASEIAADSIGASELATDAIGAAEVAASAITSTESAPLQYLTGDAFARLGAPAGASVSADIASVTTTLGAAITRQGTAQAGSSTTVTLDSGASSTTDAYKYGWLVVDTTPKQGRAIVAYNGTTKVATVSPAFVVAPTTPTFTIYAGEGH